MTAPRMTDEAEERLRPQILALTDPLFRSCCREQSVAADLVLEEMRRARAAESAALARVRRLEGLLKRVPQADCHPSEGRHSPLCLEIRAALSEET